MSYEVKVSKRALKALKSTPEPFYSRIKNAIFSLRIDPRPHGYRKLKDRDAYRIRIGNYRVIYEIYDETLIVKVIDLGHRKDIYN